MRVGVYIDGFNLYYGGRAHCGRGTPGWRWLDLRALVTKLVGERTNWSGATLTRIVYCTARINQRDKPGSRIDQAVYLKALRSSGSVDWIEYGEYVDRVKASPLARRDPQGRPELVVPDWPIMVGQGEELVPDAIFLASVAVHEEKGSDVNLATRLLIDIFTGQIDAAVVISNDSDLGLPVTEGRRYVPIGMVNPTKLRYPARALSGNPSDGVGRHWWRQLTARDFRDHQLPDPVGKYQAPVGW